MADLCRRRGISAPTLYNWNSKSRALEDETRKKLLAEQVLDNAL